MLAYVVFVHLAVLRRQAIFECLALVLLFAVPLYPSLRAGRPWAWILMLAAGIGALALTRIGAAVYALYLPPIAVPTMLMLVFARSLADGQIPIVCRFAEAASGPLDAEHRKYCRNVTWLWVLVLALQVLAALLLAALGPPWLWSAVTNFGSYALTGALFVGEYAYRRIRFRGQPQQGFLDHLRSLTRVPYRAG